MESVNIGTVTNEQTAAPEGHDEAMIAKAEGQTEAPVTETTEAPKAERPENVPEKFWDAEAGQVNLDALLKAQSDAESALRKSQSTEEPKGEVVEPSSGDETATPEVPATPEAEASVKTAEEEYAEHGSLSDATYEALAKTGLSKDVVDGYIEGQVAKAEKLTTAAYGELGGEESYKAAVTWAQGNLSTGEIAAIDALLTSADPSVVAEGAKMLAGKYNSDGEKMPTTTVTGTDTSTVGQHYKSSAELVQAMNDKRYRTDSAYRAEVSKKMDNAAKAGITLF